MAACYQSAIRFGVNRIRHAGKPLSFNGFCSSRTISAYSHSLKFINSDLWRDLRTRIFKENRRHNLWFPQSVPFFSIKIVSRRYSKIIVDFSSEFKVVLCLFWNSLDPFVNLYPGGMSSFPVSIITIIDWRQLNIFLVSAWLRPILLADERNAQGTSHYECKLSQQPVK